MKTAEHSSTDPKVLSLQQLKKTLDANRKSKKVVLCHGVFDLMHPGHILYFQAAKAHGDILVVTVTPDQFINKGPGRPVFNQRLRLKSIAALECVDYVAMNEWSTAVETIKLLKPNFYVKGQDYANAANDLTGQIKNEAAAVKAVGGQIAFTDEEMFSSSTLINRFFSPLPSATNEYLHKFRSKWNAGKVIDILKSFSDLRVLVIGEAILDQYLYCHPMAKSPKETIVASRYVNDENFAGGTLAIANHLAGFCKSVDLMALMGEEPNYQKYFRSKLPKNVKLHPIADGERPTIRKQRFVEPNFLMKMYEVQYLDTNPISKKAEDIARDALVKLLKNADLVIVADYGHGFLTERLRAEIQSLSHFLCVNVQTNSANYGFNVVTKYKNVNFVSIDEPEMKLALRNSHGEPSDLVLQLHRELKTNQLLVSRGPRGSIVVTPQDELVTTPAFSSRIVDRTGAGDALFSLVSLCAYKKVAPEVIGFIGSAVGALAVEIVCNREPINPVSLNKFITGLLK